MLKELEWSIKANKSKKMQKVINDNRDYFDVCDKNNQVIL